MAEESRKRPETPTNADIRAQTPFYDRIPPTSPGFVSGPPPEVGFGIGGFVRDRDAEGRITDFQLMEVSLVHEPPHPDWRIIRVDSDEDQEC